QATVSLLERGHHPVPRELRARLERVLAAGIPAIDPYEEIRASALAIIEAEPGISRDHVIEQLGRGRRSRSAAAAIVALVAATRVHVRSTGALRDARHTLYPGPPTAQSHTLPMADLRSRRESLGISQEALAKRAGVVQSSVSRWEKGAPIPPELRDRLERVLG